MNTVRDIEKKKDESVKINRDISVLKKAIGK